ncbi:MAG TPA: CPBP family glutamic-type intramembrane protease [Polyangiaceae bacterium]|nr:CPBP family glutamic-type intramembrane protease [Polyangiaceae bacterium]
MVVRAATEEPSERSGPLTDLALTLPIFVGYHLGVIFLPVRNAADLVTQKLHQLANQSMALYLLLTLAIGAAYVTPLFMLGRGKHLRWDRFAWMGTEGIFYAVAMRLLAGYAVAELLSAVAADPGVFGLMKAAPALSSSVEVAGQSLALGARVSGAIMSLGAGFYEEVVFRVGIYGAGVALLLFLFNVQSAVRRITYRIAWALVAAVAFSAWHHVGDMGEPFELTTFSFRALCGLVFIVIYQLRGLAPAVWTHALYDLWVLAV